MIDRLAGVGLLPRDKFADYVMKVGMETGMLVVPILDLERF